MSRAAFLIGLIGAAALSAAAAAQDSAPVQTPDASAAANAGELSRYVDRLDAVEAAKRLQYEFGYDLDLMRPDLVAGLFTDDAVVDYAGGKYLGRASVLRLFQKRWIMAGMAGKTGRQPQTVNDHYIMQPVLDAAPDGQSVLGRFRDQVFQAQGANAELSTASGLYEVRFIRVASEWKIAAMAYCEEWRTPYGTSLNYSPLPVYPAPAPKLFPEDSAGPNKISSYNCHPWPYAGITPPMHYPHPVTGEFINKP
jgi:hypothetical protein